MPRHQNGDKTEDNTNTNDKQQNGIGQDVTTSASNNRKQNTTEQQSQARSSTWNNNTDEHNTNRSNISTYRGNASIPYASESDNNYNERHRIYDDRVRCRTCNKQIYPE